LITFIVSTLQSISDNLSTFIFVAASVILLTCSFKSFLIEGIIFSKYCLIDSESLTWVINLFKTCFWFSSNVEYFLLNLSTKILYANNLTFLSWVLYVSINAFDVSIDSCFAFSIKPHVFITTIFPSSWWTTSLSFALSCEIRTSESYKFVEQPNVITLFFSSE
jgi:hypothetical protein